MSGRTILPGRRLAKNPPAQRARATQACAKRAPAGMLAGAGFLLSAVFPALGMEPQWPPGAYRYLIVDQDLKGVLTEFGRNTGLPVDVSDQVKGRLRGQLASASASAREYLDRLCESYGLVWYFDGAVLHVNAKSETTTELVNIGRLSAADASEKLRALGIADGRFQVRTTEEAGVISVSGPPAFVSLVRQTLAALLRRMRPAGEETASDDVRVRVFRGGTGGPPAAPPEIAVDNRARRRS